jgi:pSer/pThr/pTyr-binding forkhead associated (FHA) protein
MAFVTLAVLEGLERGHVFRNLKPPVTIGREEVNDVQLNDERISRLHAKLQEDQGSIIFTDLNSTNGSRVNGHPVQLRVLRPGDHLQLGRCTLLFGSPEEISARARQLGVSPMEVLPLSRPELTDSFIKRARADGPQSEDILPASLFCGERPPLPSPLSSVHRARLSDLLMYIHELLQDIIMTSSEADAATGFMLVDWARFQNLLRLQNDLAHWLNVVVNPDTDSPAD